MNSQLVENMILGCGMGHLGLSIGSLYVPKALRWGIHLATLQPLIRQMFWTYAGYILVINISFGIISLFGANELLNGSFLAKSITLLIGIYWLARVAIQFLYFDRSHAPKGFIFLLGEAILVFLFVVFAATYLTAFLMNMSWI